MSTQLSVLRNDKPRQELGLPFVPSLETVTAGPADIPVVPVPPLELLKHKDNSKDVPLIVGISENEGWLFAAGIFFLTRTNLALNEARKIGFLCRKDLTHV